MCSGMLQRRVMSGWLCVDDITWTNTKVQLKKVRTKDALPYDSNQSLVYDFWKGNILDTYRACIRHVFAFDGQVVLLAYDGSCMSLCPRGQR
jgi:hypothetical protein